jgi:hypothetical protein
MNVIFNRGKEKKSPCPSKMQISSIEFLNIRKRKEEILKNETNHLNFFK